MNRTEWLRERRRVTEQRYDELHAPIYDQKWGSAISPTHERFFKRFLDACPPHAHILDAACGTGKYWPLILNSGRTVAGTDQSGEMLKRATGKFPEVRVEKIGLQELGYQGIFDAACCMDAMECVFPEDWLTVLKNLRRAVKPGGRAYFTVEVADPADLERALSAGRQMGLPLLHGEWAHEGGYHYYPELDQVREWIRQADLELIEESSGDEYEHFLVKH